MQNILTIEAPAKINLTLDVLGKRADGFHEVETVMHQIDLFDLIRLQPGEQGIELSCSSPKIPEGEDNLAYKAARIILQELGRGAGIKIYIDKRIPVGAGLAGGSTDAAAVLAGINHLYGNQFSHQDLLSMAAAIGSDVAFCLPQYYMDISGVLAGSGATAVARGRGEIIEPLPAVFIPFILIVKPGFSLSTARIYAELDRQAVDQPLVTRSFLQSWYNSDIISIVAHMGNMLEPVSISSEPEIGAIKARLMAQGAYNAQMSGSGPSVFGIFPDKATASQAFMDFKKDYQEVYLVSSYRRGD
jgi:4-diphosphocytidyl-2-C-methyl-D-erythritol kinase